MWGHRRGRLSSPGYRAAGWRGDPADDIDHGYGHGHCGAVFEVAVEWQTGSGGRSMGAGKRNAQDGISAEPPLVGRGVEVDECAVDDYLFGGIHADDAGRDFAVDTGHGPEDTSAFVPFGVAVSELLGLVRAGGGTGGDDSATLGSVSAVNLHFHRGIPAGVQNLTPRYGCYGRYLDSNQAITLSSFSRDCSTLAMFSQRMCADSLRIAWRDASSRMYSAGDLPSTRAISSPPHMNTVVDSISTGARSPKLRR